ncbi:MAG TPA: hypothetical protein PK446_01435, partial [Methanomassiliicoccaceae archaeon]|nr:hypothetical protein [Methanomassiliicoccaceae archaeon]
MNITTDEFFSLAKKYQALGSSTQRLLEDVRRGSFKVHDGVRLRQLYEFLLDLQFVQGDISEVHEMTAAVGRMLAEQQDEEEEKIVARYDAHQRRRLKAKPGITGLQQVEARGIASLDERIRRSAFPNARLKG